MKYLDEDVQCELSYLTSTNYLSSFPKTIAGRCHYATRAAPITHSISVNICMHALVARLKALLLSRYVKPERGGISTILAMLSWFKLIPDLFQHSEWNGFSR